MSTQVRIEGLREFRRDLRRIDAELPKGVTKALKASAEIVATEARIRAPVGPSGRLKGSIRSFTRGDRAGVRVNAKRRSPRYPGGYPYPRRIEFQLRPFLHPALVAKQRQVAERMERVIDDVADIWEG